VGSILIEISLKLKEDSLKGVLYKLEGILFKGVVFKKVLLACDSPVIVN
jgi:hypothetical protein